MRSALVLRRAFLNGTTGVRDGGGLTVGIGHFGSLLVFGYPRIEQVEIGRRYAVVGRAGL